MEETNFINTVLFSMEPLLERARISHKWLASRYHGIAFSPRELRDMMSRDRMCWGPNNWELIDPFEWQKLLLTKLEQAQKDYDNFTARLNEEGV